MDDLRKASFLLRLAVAFVFLYSAIWHFIDPESWIGFFPQWTAEIAPPERLLPIFAVYEIALGLGILFARRVFLPASLAAALTLLVIVLSNLGAFDIVYRDVAIALSAIALLFLARSRG